MTSSIYQRVFLILAACGIIWFSFYLRQPPKPQPSNSPETEFSAGRALGHIRSLAKQPHPLGTAAHENVRNYLVSKLRELGLKPETIEGVSAIPDRHMGAYIQNIFVRIPGSNPSNTLLLMAHYDSAPNALGAADDGSGVAAILESIRALKARPKPLKNNVWILFTDGEERGLLGAQYFTEYFADLKQIDLVLNLEARGSSGPSMMFESSSPNGALIPGFAHATPYPVANSLMYTVYKMLPNDTDLSVTKRAGLDGLNFAFTKEFLNYHTMQDNPQNLSLASLQHQGSNLLSNIRYFGNRAFNFNSDSDYVYFNSLIGGLAYYPASWSFPLAIATSLIFVIYLVFLFRTGRLTFGSYLGSLLLFIGMITVTGLVTYFGWRGLELLNPEYQWLQHGENYHHIWYFWGFTLLTTGIFSGIYGMRWIRKRLSIQQLLAGGVTVWILLSLGTSWYLPTASYIFTWPVLLSLIGWITLGKNITKKSWTATLVLMISLVGVLFMLPFYLYQVQVMLTTRFLAISMVLLVLILGLCWPLLYRVSRPRLSYFVSGLLAGATFCFISASVKPAFDSQHKKQNDMNYVVDLDSGKAYWYSRDHRRDSWTEQFLGRNYQRGKLPGTTLFQNNSFLYAEAPLAKLKNPVFTITSDSSSDSLRYLEVQIKAGTPGVGLYLDWPDQTPILSMSLQGHQIFSSSSRTQPANSSNSDFLYFTGLDKPIPLSVTFDKKGELSKLTCSFISMGLPTGVVGNYRPRANYMMPKISWLSNTTIRQTSVRLDTLR